MTSRIIFKYIPIKKLLHIVSILIVVSCSTPKNVTYFQELENLDVISIENKDKIRYQPHDIVSIKISAPDPETVLPFNSNLNINTETENNGNTQANSAKVPTYLIDAEGIIEFPVIGNLKIAGLTNVETKNMIKDSLKSYVNNPIVSVKLENFKVMILGEVNNPGPYSINNEQATIIDAIGLAGDLGIRGKRKDITVLRKQNNKQIVYKIDLTSKDIFNSPVYYLAQDDIIYIEPNKYRIKDSKNNEWPRILTSTASILGIIISIIAITR